MKVKCWLAVTSGGSVRITKSQPRLDRDEIAIAVAIDIPGAYFTRPQLALTIELPEAQPVPEANVTISGVAVASEPEIDGSHNGSHAATGMG